MVPPKLRAIRKRIFRHAILSLLCFIPSFFLITSANAQTANLSGLVADPSGAVIRGADITFTNERTNAIYHAKANGSGIYSLPFLQPGQYTLTAEASGFKRYLRTGITVEVAQNLDIDVRLEVGGASQSVTVDGSGHEINTTDATVGTVIDRQFVENIPLSGRSFQPLLTLIPGVMQVPVGESSGTGYAGEFTVNGQRSEENYFTVDGVGVNTGIYTQEGPGIGAGFGGATLGETSLGTTQSLISIDALQEFSAKTSTYSVEYGRTPGGQFSFSSRSGTNHLHGSAFDYFRNGATSANAWFNNYYQQPRLEEHQNDFGGTFGGPIVLPRLYNGRDKSFFFFSYEGLRLKNPVAANLTAVPSLALRQSAAPGLQPLLGGFPLPLANATNLGGDLYGYTSGYVSPGRLDAFSLRLDQHVGDKLLLFGRMSYSPSSSVTRSSYDLANVGNLNGTIGSITLGATATFNSRASNDLRFNFTRNKQKNNQSIDTFGGATPFVSSTLPGLLNSDAAGIYLFYNVLYPYANTSNAQSRQRQINLVDTFHFVAGKHALSIGFDYRSLHDSQSAYDYWEWGMTYSEANLISGVIDNAVLYKLGAAPHPVYQNYSAFAQDTWKTTPRITLSYGLRWDVNPAPTDAKGNNPYTLDQVTDLATTQLAPQGTPLWKTTYGNVAPRLSAAWQAHQQPGHETVFRAGGGLFFDTGTANASNGYYGPGFVNESFGSAAFPFSQQKIADFPAPNSQPPYGTTVYAYNPHFQAPYTIQWNVAVEQALGSQQSLTLSYVGSAGRRLLAQKYLYPDVLGNAAFSEGDGLQLGTNDASSDYSALQVQFQRRLSHGLQALVSYTWSHSLDDSSTNFQAQELERASSDFDVRNNFDAAITYDVPALHTGHLVETVVNHWSFDTRISARSATPVDVIANEGTNPTNGTSLNYHPNRVLDQPLYLHDPSLPGGRIVNAAAYSTPTDENGNPLLVEGNAGRNSARGFDAIQADLALRREFPIREGVGLQFRAEAFNILNHPIFGAVYNQLNSSPNSTTGSSLFGQAYQTLNTSLGTLNPLYQSGGPRSLQFALRLHF